MPGSIAIGDLILNYDPEFPKERFRSAGVAVVLKHSSGRRPDPFKPP
jgi:hypothetical protein